MMIHFAIHWSEITDTTLWPMCVNHAEWIYNHIPNVKTDISPNDLWLKSKFPFNCLQDVHVFGCPIYVLKKKYADKTSMPKWKHILTKECIWVEHLEVYLYF